MGDDDSVCFVLLKYRLEFSHQIEPIGINQCVARKTTERQLLHAGNAFELRKLSKQLTVAQSLIRLDVPSKIQAIGAHRIDRPAGEDQSHSREQGSHSQNTPRSSLFLPVDGRPHLPFPGTASLTAFNTSGYARQRQIARDRKSTRLNSSHLGISYAVFCLKKKRYK